MCLKAKLPKISGDMNDFYEFMLYVIGAMKHFGMGPLAIKTSFGFCPSSISLGANPNAMIPKEYLDFINIYARKMMGQNSGQFIGFSSIMREKEAMRDLEEEFAKEGEKVDAKVDTKKPVKPTAHKRFEEQSTLSGAQTLLSMSKGSKPASDEFVTHVNNKMTRSLNSKSASNHKAKKLVSSEQSEPEPAYAALKPPSRTRNGSPAFRDTDSVTSVRSGQSTTSKTNYIGSYKHLVCKDCGHRGHNSMKYGPCPANENSDSGSYSE